MRYLIIIALVVCINNLSAQTSLERDLFELETQIYSANSDSAVNSLLIKKVETYLLYKEFSYDLVRDSRRINLLEITDSLTKCNLLWNLAVAYNIMEDYNYATYYYEEYYKLTKDESINTKLLAIMIYGPTDSLYFNDYYASLTSRNSAKFSCLKCLTEIDDIKLDHQKRYINASRILPGLGTMLLKDYFNGAGSLFFNAASVTAVYALAKNQLYFGAAIWSFMLVKRFYSGNIILTKQTFKDKEAEKRSNFAEECSNKIIPIFNEFPIEFRLNSGY